MVPTQPTASGLRRSSPPTAAFTLVELLVVIGIIAVLISLLLPTLSYANAHARFVRCKTNIRSQLQAHQLYCIDFKGAKPPLWRKASITVKYDYVSPDIKWSGTPVGQGLLIDRKYLTIESLLDPSEGMIEDIERDRDGWLNQANAGSSYAYFWRRPPTPVSIADLAKGASYTNQNGRGSRVLVLDLNAEVGHTYAGEYANRPWLSHPKTKRMNVGYIDGAVRDFPIADVLLTYPAGSFEELDWVAIANKM